MNIERISRRNVAAVLGVFLAVTFSSSAFAATVDANDVASNIVTSVSDLPGMVAGLAYLMGLVLGVTAIFKIKDHVENPNQTPLRTGLIRLLIGGAFFAFPTVYNAVMTTIDGNGTEVKDAAGNVIGVIATRDGFGMSALFNGTGKLLTSFTSFAIPTFSIDTILGNIIDSIDMLPALVRAVAYLLGLVAVFAGLLKLKEHVENPDQTPMREPVVRLLTGGALFAMPFVYEVMSGTLSTGLWGSVQTFFSFSTLSVSPMSGATFLCIPGSLGGTLCQLVTSADRFPAFLSALSYLFGLVMGLWGILKIRDHALNPTQTTIWEGVSRLIAGGAFFSLPIIVSMAGNFFSSDALKIMTGSQVLLTKYNEANGPCTGLDGALSCFMKDIMAPLNAVLNLFVLVAGMILVMIGIHRLTKSAQEGPRGPGGLGTMCTFLAGGALISSNELMRVFTGSMGFGFLGMPVTATYATLQYTGGLSATEVAHAHTVISAILKFVIVIGLISFVRGIFLMREVAEGNNQASLMAGVTHMVGGALAVNLGPLMTAVQSTLGMTGYGITFGGGLPIPLPIP